MKEISEGMAKIDWTSRTLQRTGKADE